MSSAFWLLLYLAPLLMLTAAVFAWLGWQWRGNDMQKPVVEIETLGEIVAEPPQTVIDEPHVRHEEITNELTALRDDLKAAQSQLLRSQEDATKARDAAKAQEAETQRLQRDFETIRAERDHAAAELNATRSKLEQMRAQAALKEAQSATPAIESPAPAVEKPKRKRSTTTKPKKAAPVLSLREKITALENQRDAHPSTGAPEELAKLQNQIEVLQRVEQQSAMLTLAGDDDLTQIKGIKKIISEQLRAHGIRTWKQIAGWNEDELRAFSELLAFKNRASREKWQEQARTLHEAAHGPLS